MDIVDSVPVYVVDRRIFKSRAALVAIVVGYLKIHATVQVEDSRRQRGDRVVYEIRPNEAVVQLFDAHGRQIGLFADVAALVDHAEVVTR